MKNDRTISFTKMHGAGNDYVYIDCFKNKTEDDLPFLAKRISDRHFGVGGDGLVLIMPSDKADFGMRIFNSDGSEAEMCGNAVRCVGKYVFDKGITKKTTITVDTLAGIKVLDLFPEAGAVKSIRVDMGEPVFKAENIPVTAQKDKFISEPIEVFGEYFVATCVSMGNPHAVIYVDDVNNISIEKAGPLIERHEIFPKRTNVEFVKVINRELLEMRVWERGAGETLACGTGACAVLAASVINGLSARKAVIKLSGGELEIEWNEADNHIYMTGPAEFVFEGEYYIGG